MSTPCRATRKVIAVGAVAIWLAVACLLGTEYWGSRNTRASVNVVHPAPVPGAAVQLGAASPPPPAVAVVATAATTSPMAVLSDLDLAGNWTCTTTRGQTYAVTAQRLASRKYALQGARSTVLDGDYEIRGDSLRMVASPSLHRGFVWRVTDWGYGGFVTFTLVTTDYAGATLTRSAQR
jgi:hypothetical protein